MQKQYCYDTVSNLGFRIGYGFSKNEGVIMQIRLNAKTIKLKSNVTYFGFSGGDGSITNNHANRKQKLDGEEQY